MKKKLLFVCIENSNRSQMAQAFATMYAANSVEAYSAGSKPSGVINAKAITAMKDLGYDLTKHDSKSLEDIPDIEYDYVITMGCGDACPYVKAKHRDDWAISDPRNMEPNEFNKVRDMIGLKVKSLIDEINGPQS
jgi:arsenate reductase